MPEKNVGDEDMKAAIERPDTGDGPGTDNPDDLPESDFVGFAEDDAEAGPQATANHPLRLSRRELHRRAQRDGPRHPQVVQEDVGHAAPQRWPGFRTRVYSTSGRYVRLRLTSTWTPPAPSLSTSR
jgi:hypothetical protein